MLFILVRKLLLLCVEIIRFCLVWFVNVWVMCVLGVSLISVVSGILLLWLFGRLVMVMEQMWFVFLLLCVLKISSVLVVWYLNVLYSVLFVLKLNCVVLWLWFWCVCIQFFCEMIIVMGLLMIFILVVVWCFFWMKVWWLLLYCFVLVLIFLMM